METNIQDAKDVIDLMNEVVLAFNKLDMEKLLSLHTDNIILMEPGWPAIEGKEKVKEIFAGLEKKRIKLNLDFKIHELEVIRHRAFVRGQVINISSQDGGAPIKETGKFICLLIKQECGKWLRSHVIMNYDHASKKEVILNDIV